MAKTKDQHFALIHLQYLLILGFLEKEIHRAEIPILDTGENPDAPAPREMIDLEVSN